MVFSLSLRKTPQYVVPIGKILHIQEIVHLRTSVCIYAITTETRKTMNEYKDSHQIENAERYYLI
jgi:hypothetical protein